MVAISLMVLEHTPVVLEQHGPDWPRWKHLVAEVETLGFAGLYRGDHFTSAFPSGEESPEMMVALTYLASQTQRLSFGTLVAPLSFRHPVLLLRQAVALGELSAGRMILGVGTGWEEGEHQMFGFDVGDVPTRLARLQEGLEVITRLLESSEPVTYEGRFFQLRGARLLSRKPRSARLPLLIGGNGVHRTLPLVAHYADIWNGQRLTPEAFQQRSARLDALLSEAGRPPESVKRTLYCWLHFGRTIQELDQVLAFRHSVPELAGRPLAEVIEMLRTEPWGNRLVGTPDMLIEQIQAYADAGVEELVLHWFELDNRELLRGFAQSILPMV